jgi:transcriptional regulator with XRE-family HTH domain
MSKRFMDLLNELDSTPLTSGRLLRAFRKRWGLTLKELEEITEIKEQNLSALENDRMSMTVHYAEILAVALGARPTDLLFPNGKWERPPELAAVERRAKKILSKKKAV